MHYIALTVSALVLISIATSTCVAAQESHDDGGCLPMADLTAIVFKQTMTQNRRRSSNVPSLQCIGNCPAGLIQAHCTKQGSDDYGRPTWKCSPQFANEGGEAKRVLYGLGNIQVECEGCSKKGDSNVVRGSCSLKYSITTGGNRKAGMRRHYGREHYGSSSHDAIGAVVWLIFGVTTVAATIAICRGCLAKPYQTSAKSEYTTDGNGNVYGAPMYAGGGGGAVHHHYGGSGGGGFGTGMLTGFVLGDMMSRSHYAPGYGYGYEGAVAEYGGGFGFGGNDGAFDSAGWGGTDSI